MKKIIFYIFPIFALLILARPAYASNNIFHVNSITRNAIDNIQVNWTLDAKENIPALSNPDRLIWAVYLVEGSYASSSLSTVGSDPASDGRLFNVLADGTCAPPHLADLTNGTTQNTDFSYVYNAWGDKVPVASSTASTFRFVAYENSNAFCNLHDGNELSTELDTQVYNMTGLNYDPAKTISILSPVNSQWYVLDIAYVNTRTTGITATTSNAVVYFATSSFTNAPFQSPSNAYFSVYPQIIASGTSTQTTSLKKSLYLGSTTQWYAKAELYSDNYSVFNGSSSITFTVAHDYTEIPESEYVFPLTDIFDTMEDCSIYPFTHEYFGGTVAFFATSSVDNIMCNSQNWFKRTVNTMGHGVQVLQYKSLQIINKVFPFSVFHHLDRDIQFAQENATSSSELILNEGNDPNMFGGRAYAVFTSTTVSDAEAHTGFNIRDFLDYIMFGATGIIIIYFTALTIGALKPPEQQLPQ